MGQQVVNTKAVDTTRQKDGTDLAQKVVGDLVVGVRVDAVPSGEAERLAADGKFYPLTLTKNGELRVALPDDTRVEMKTLAVLEEIRDLLRDNRDLLAKIA